MSGNLDMNGNDIVEVSDIQNDGSAGGTAVNINDELTVAQGLTVAGNAQIDGVLSSAGTFEINDSDGVNITGNTTVTGTSALNGNTTVTGTLTATQAFTVQNGGATVTSGGLTVTAGGATVTAGGLTVTAGNTELNDNVTLGSSSADEITVNGEVLGANPFIFEGAANDNITTTLAIAGPTGANKVITLPNATGEVVLNNAGETRLSTGGGAQTLTTADNNPLTINSGTGLTTIGDGAAAGTANVEGTTFSNNDVTVPATGTLTLTGATLAIDGETLTGVRDGAEGVRATGAALDTETVTELAVANALAAQTLQTAYVNGNTITTTGGEGAVTLAGNQNIEITTTGATNISGGAFNATGNVNLGNAAVDVITVDGTTTFNESVTIADGDAFNANGAVTLGNAATDVITVTGEIAGATPLAFEGTTADDVYTTFAITDPTVARTITFPDATGTVLLGSSDTDPNFTGNVTLGNAAADVIDVNGTTNFDAPVTVTDGIAFTANGAVTLGNAAADAIAINGTTTFNEAVTVSDGDAFTANGAVTLGNAAADVIDVNGTTNFDQAVTITNGNLNLTQAAPQAIAKTGGALNITADGANNITLNSGAGAAELSVGNNTLTANAATTVADGFLFTANGNSQFGNANTDVITFTGSINANDVGNTIGDGATDVAQLTINGQATNDAVTAATADLNVNGDILATATIRANQIQAFGNVAAADISGTPLAGDSQQLEVSGNALINGAVVTEYILTGNGGTANEINNTTNVDAVLNRRIQAGTDDGITINDDIATSGSGLSVVYDDLGSTGDAIFAATTGSGNALNATNTGTGNGITVNNSGGGTGIDLNQTTGGAVNEALDIDVTGAGGGNGVSITTDQTGDALEINTTGAASDGINITASGANADGIVIGATDAQGTAISISDGNFNAAPAVRAAAAVPGVPGNISAQGIIFLTLNDNGIANGAITLIDTEANQVIYIMNNDAGDVVVNGTTIAANSAGFVVI